jgi:hypothetical protein
MAYQVDKFNGQFLTSVEDGSIDNTTDIRFVGKNYAGYGEVQNENFLHMLENFANTTAPPRAIAGQVWYDSGNKKLKFYDGSKFKIANGAEVTGSAPAGLEIGEFWWDNTTNQLYTWSGSEFILVGPETSNTQGVSAAVPQVVKDTGGTNHTILKLNAGGETVGIVSDDEFLLNTTLNPIDGFTTIKKGFTLTNTDVNGISGSSYVYWGTASNALKINGLSSDDFVQKGNVSFNQGVTFDDSGFTLGDSNDLKINVESDKLYLRNQLGNEINFRIVVEQQIDERDVLVVDKDGMFPGQNETFDIGSASLKYDNVYARTFTGNITGNVTGNTTGTHTGNLLANDSQVIVDAANKVIGYAGADIRGILVGDVQGSLQGTATNAIRLNNILPSIPVPSDANKESIVARNSTGSVFATTFEGVATFADRLKIDDSATDTDPDYKSAKTTPVADSIAARTASGNLKANLFEGTATAAQYADLAEKYLTDEEYKVGVVVKVGGTAEVTACTQGSRAIGVVSENPAFMMNTDLVDGTYIALKGRVPVKVGGKVAKGDTLIAGQNGYATSSESGHIFAVALEDSDDESVKLIEAIVL